MENLPLLLKIIIYVFSFFIGASVFSFLEVLIIRIPQKKSFISGHSVCDSCGHELSALDMIPVFGWLLLGGKCRYCKTKFPPTSSIKEFIGGLLAVVSVLKFGFTLEALCVFAFICVLNPVAFIDAKTMEIPDGFPIAAAVIGIAAAFVSTDVLWWERLIGALCVSVPLFIITLIVKEAFGDGDIKLTAACGIFLGWKLTVFSFFIAVIAAGAWGVYLLASKKLSKGGHFAFGPFLCAGMLPCALIGNEITAFLSKLI